MANVVESLLGLWLSSPSKLAAAVAVPASVLAEYVTGLVWLSPPAPVTLAEQGVCADPLYVTLTGQVTTVVDAAALIRNVFESLLPEWLESPAKLAAAVAVPVAVLVE